MAKTPAEQQYDDMRAVRDRHPDLSPPTKATSAPGVTKAQLDAQRKAVLMAVGELTSEMRDDFEEQFAEIQKRTERFGELVDKSSELSRMMKDLSQEMREVSREMTANRKFVEDGLDAMGERIDALDDTKILTGATAAIAEANIAAVKVWCSDIMHRKSVYASGSKRLDLMKGII